MRASILLAAVTPAIIAQAIGKPTVTTSSTTNDTAETPAVAVSTAAPKLPGKGMYPCYNKLY